MILDKLVQYVSNHRIHICTDSRTVQKGDVFVAHKGNAVDGHHYIPDAMKRGAHFIVYEQCYQAKVQEMLHQEPHIDLIGVDNSNLAAATLAQAVYDRPSKKLTNLAVTGTNGKTTVAYLVHHCLLHAGQSCGVISTIVYDTGQSTTPATLTTPDCVTIAHMQAQMVQAGCRYMITEASSHALSQDRLAGIPFTSAAFTNLSGDHLDYHKTEKAYLRAKSRLFAGLSPDAVAVLNQQSPSARIIAQQTKANLLWYAINEQADLQARVRSMDDRGTHYDLYYQDQHQQVHSPLLGTHNVSNHLAAAGLCLSVGLDLQTIAQGLISLAGIPGRLERIEWPGDYTILIDYAHTDDALDNVLCTLRPLCQGRLITVFGCGGDRDRTKRPRMARVVQQYSDKIIVTSDNPRYESPQQIIDDILQGFSPSQQAQVTVESDRRMAIGMAIEQAQAHDIILIAGKGHETYQRIGDQELHFSDKEVVHEALKHNEQI